MKRRAIGANRFLLIYLICYLVIGFKGPAVMSKQATNLLLQISPLILGILYFFITRQNPIKALSIKPFHIASIPFVILYTYLLWPFVSVINAISQLFSKNLVTEVVTQNLAGKGLGLTILTMAALPAFMEEFTFRGVYYQGIRQNPKIKAILIASLCFGLMHMNINQFCYAFLLGIFMALIIEATGSLLSSMLVHFTFNANSVLLANATRMSSLANDTTETLNSSSTTLSPEVIKETVLVLMPFAIGGLILAILLLLLIAKINKRSSELKNLFFAGKDESGQTKTKEKIITPTLLLFFVICICMCIRTIVINNAM